MSARTLTWILDRHTGQLTVEGLGAGEAAALAGDLLPQPRAVNCARPLAPPPLPAPGAAPGDGAPTLRVVHLYHGSVVEGPGRRSVAQLGGCVHACPGCYAPETHPLGAGVPLPVSAVVAALLDPAGAPRDGVTVLGGEPLLQPAGLAALLGALKAAGQHVTLYTGYTLAALRRRREPAIAAVLALTDLLVDGRYVAALADGAGEWRGSRNQQVIDLAARRADTG
ncbi:MAG TPA: 4Fe-4S single cluster domain-containing protein [Thermomicrobiales bacterium]|nr:4Fe-4S single cluster domain-containing protein [Thermomicrobiales bacterium]